MICLSSAGSLASFDGGFRGARPHREQPRAGTGGPRSPGGEERHRARRGVARQNGARVRRRSSRGLSTPAGTRVRRRRRARKAALGGRAREPRLPRAAAGSGDERESSLAPRRMEAPLEETCVRAEPGCAICVQRFDDSLNSAIRTTYRISLRSSSLREPRYPSAGVVGFHKLRQRRRESPRCAREGAVGRGEPRARPRRNTSTPHSPRRETRGVRARVGSGEPPGQPRAPRERGARDGVRRGTVQHRCGLERPVMILPQVHLRKPCYDFSFL